MNKLVNGKFTAPACGLIKPEDRGDDDWDFVCVLRSVCVCDGDEDGGGGGRRGGVVREKWKAPVIKSVKECERGAHRSKQTFSRDSSLFIYAPPIPLHSLPLP